MAKDDYVVYSLTLANHLMSEGYSCKKASKNKNNKCGMLVFYFKIEDGLIEEIDWYRNRESK